LFDIVKRLFDIVKQRYPSLPAEHCHNQSTSAVTMPSVNTEQDVQRTSIHKLYYQFFTAAARRFLLKPISSTSKMVHDDKRLINTAKHSISAQACMLQMLDNVKQISSDVIKSILHYMYAYRIETRCHSSNFSIWL